MTESTVGSAARVMDGAEKEKAEEEKVDRDVVGQQQQPVGDIIDRGGGGSVDGGFVDGVTLRDLGSPNATSSRVQATAGAAENLTTTAILSTSLSDLFDHVVELVRDPTIILDQGEEDEDEEAGEDDDEYDITNDIKMSDQDKLRLYGLYKFIRDGPCPASATTSSSSPPSVFQPVARAKYFAWKECSDQYYYCDVNEQEDEDEGAEGEENQKGNFAAAAAAKTEYIELVASKNDRLGRYCHKLWKQHCSSSNNNDDNDDVGDETRKCPGTDNTESATNSTRDSPCSDNNSKNIKNDEIIPSSTSFHTSDKAETTSLSRTNAANNLHTNTADDQQRKRQNLGPIQPMLPRGRLDISYTDLWYAIRQCMFEMVPFPSLLSSSSSMNDNELVSEQICQLWKDATATNKIEKQPSTAAAAAVGLSVRSLFDLYLTSKRYPAGSEIIVVPPISVPGMMLVARYHNLDIVPVDISQNNKNKDKTITWVDLDSIRSKITERTVAIMIVHPFGIVTVDNDTMKELRAIADSNDIELWEDCAESFVGLGLNDNVKKKESPSSVGSAISRHDNRHDLDLQCYLGDDLADVRFFSFGNIKTSTSLGGGIAVFRDDSTCREIVRLQKAIFYKQQQVGEYLVRVLLALALNFVADSPLRVGLLVFLCKSCGMDFESVVTYAVRGFRLSNSSVRDGAAALQLITQIRKRPSTPLLKLLLRRLNEAMTAAPFVATRIRQCRMVESLLRKQLPDVILTENETSLRTHWIYPIVIDRNPSEVSKSMSRMGFDVVNGASQLCSVARYTAQPTSRVCENTDRLMDSILYLPICSQEVSDSKLRKLVSCLKKAVDSDSVDHAATVPIHSGKEKDLSKQSSTFSLLSASVCLFVVAAAVYLVNDPTCRLLYRSLSIGSTVFLSVVVVLVGVQALLQWTTADFYLRQSSCFAEHCDMIEADFQNGNRVKNSSGNSIISDMDMLNLVDEEKRPEIVPGRSIILTGATGFVGSSLLRDLLDNRKRLNLTRIIVLCRSKGKMSASKRIEKLLSSSMFSFCTDDDKKQMIEVVEGDVTQPSAGLKSFDLARIFQDASITHVFHCAAVVTFMQEFPDAARSNITSALTMQSITSGLKSPEALFVHVSTAFVHGDQTGSHMSPLPENLFSFDPFDPRKIYKSMLGTQYYASRAMNELGFHNTYSFSKSVCEHLLVRNRRSKTIILRPSIVGPAAELPFEGWAGDRPSTIVAGPCLHLSNQWNIWCLGEQIVPCIPVDVLSRFIISKSFVANASSSQSGSDTASSSDGSFEHIEKLSQASSDFEDIFSAESSESSVSHSPKIFNASWNVTSNQNAAFSWLDFSIAYLHLGSMLGVFSRTNALLQVLISAQIMPRLLLSHQTYERLHHVVIRGPIEALVAIGRRLGFWTFRLEKLLSFLDLPVLFYPFMRSDFVFQSEIIAPESFDAKRYAFSCGVAAYRFISKMKRRHHDSAIRPEQRERLKFFPIGGNLVDDGRFHIWWAFSQPIGNLFFKCAGVFVRYLLYLTSTVVTIDIISFRDHFSAIKSLSENGPVFLVLAPTHRSCLDFILLSYAFFSLPELQVGLPFIAAADDFYHIPILGWLAKRLQAFYIRRGKSNVDKNLEPLLKDLKALNLSSPHASLEVYIEGRRSRDRRFVPPRTGFLKCLQESGGSHVILPITVSYESIPEQETLTDEASGLRRSELSLPSTIKWLWKAVRGGVRLGKIHISTGKSLTMRAGAEVDFKGLVDAVQLEQQSQVIVSDYHVRAASAFFGVEEADMQSAMRSIGCKFWPTFWQSELPKLPCDQTKLLSIVLQFGHLFATLLPERQEKWAKWLDCSCGNTQKQVPYRYEQERLQVFQLIIGYFDMADRTVNDAITMLRKRGFESPKPSHIFQTAKSINVEVPLSILNAAIELETSNFIPDEEVDSDSLLDTLLDDTSLQTFGSMEMLGHWGYHDSGFVARVDHNGRRYVTLKGDRYALCGRPITKLLPFIETELRVKIDLSKEFPRGSSFWQQTVESDLSQHERLLLHTMFQERVSFLTVERARHGSGHSQEDVFWLRTGDADVRIPDAVVWPSTEKEVIGLVKLAKTSNWCLIPFGGGTNVINATRCPTKSVEPRPILSVDMKHLNSIEWLNEEDGLAKVQAGIVGRDLMEQLEQRGFTMGHEPDSVEFSTLGGWIATKASGMKRSKYGNIEDILVSCRVVSTSGVLWKGSPAENQRTSTGRHSEGLDVSSLAIGSEGCLGIVTSAVIRVCPLPEAKQYDGILFPSFEDGLKFLRALRREKPLMPSCVRLLDNEHFRLGQALRPETTAVFERLKDLASKMLFSATLSTKYSSESVVCATISYEGSCHEVQNQISAVHRLAQSYDGVVLGPKVGKAGYDLTFMIAYLRDFAMTYHILGESFETFCPWSKIESLVAATKKRLVTEHASRLLPGTPFVGCRVTQLYHEGVCLYFYLCMSFDGIGQNGSDRPSEVFADLERAARDEILRQGGSLSHHHGVGKVRSRFLNQRTSEDFQRLASSIKDSVDRDNIFGARNGMFWGDE